MSIVWQQRISHFDRPVKRRHMRVFRNDMLKRDIREKRGYPSDGHSSAYSRAWLEYRIALRRGKDVTTLKARLEFMRLRERMLSKKLRDKRVARNRRRPSVSDTGINLAKLRREYLAQQDAMRASWSEEFSPGTQGFKV
jgi:hypothetical protein